MTGVHEFRLEADRKLSKAAETQQILRTSLALASEQVASLTSQLAELGPPSAELLRTLEQVRSELLIATKATTAAHEVVTGEAQKLATFLERLWPWMKQRCDEILVVHRRILKGKDDQEQKVLASLRVIVIGLTLLVLSIGASTWVQWQKVSAVQQASAMCQYGERLVAILPGLPLDGQAWIKTNIMTPVLGN